MLIAWFRLTSLLLLTNILVVILTFHQEVPLVPALEECSLARQQSNGFFQDIPNAEWIEFYQTPARLYQPYRVPTYPNQHSSEDVPFWVFHNWDPYFSCPRSRMIGGRQLCDPDRILGGSSATNDPCLVYAFGDGELWASEMNQYAQGTCEIYVFGTSNRTESQENVTFRYWDPDRESSAESITNERKRLRHEDRLLDVLFLDCSGCEWTLFRSFLEQSPQQLILQTHDLPSPDSPKNTKFGVLPPLSASDFFETIRSHGYALFAKRVLSATEECTETDWSFVRAGL